MSKAITKPLITMVALGNNLEDTHLIIMTEQVISPEVHYLMFSPNILLLMDSMCLNHIKLFHLGWGRLLVVLYCCSRE